MKHTKERDNNHTSTRLATRLTRPAIITSRGCFRTLATVFVGLLVGVTSATGEEPLPKGPALSAETLSARNFFDRKFTGSRTDFTGNVGFEFVPAEALSVTALGRSVSGDAIRRTHAVTLWDSATEKPLARVTVSPGSKVDGQGFAFERLAVALKLEKDRSYRITSGEEAGGDPMMEIGDISAHLPVADVGLGVFAVGDAYPKQTYGRTGQGYGLPTLYFDTTGLAPELFKAGPRLPKPFLRELTTGYLLQYSFMSPRPYVWADDKTVMLSGWEVDKSGGHFEYEPSGFAFHNDWFKLVDTSSDGAITLKHQVARQTEGAVTFEFRFKLPTAMEGACWQLRDLEQAGVSLVTKGGNLCWETGKVLMPCETNRDYGVKIIADLGAKKADVFVDGELRASGLPFVKPIKSIDYVLVKTGDAATGEMFLNPVNLHKGYSVNETFVTCGVGKAPADWEVKDSSVQPFECATKPDIFSLKVTGEALRKIGAWKGKTVFECRYLLPNGIDGVNVNLGGVALERIAPYRSNLWYMAKVIAEPKSRTAEVFINGKLLPEKITFPKTEETIRFAGNVWVDDVQVYAWRDYPADYVPQPKPVVASHILGVQSCNLWREGTSYAGWDYVRPYAAKRKPYLGWYDEGNPEVADWEIKWQVEHGIGFEMHCWYRPNNAINHPIKDGVLDQGIIKGLFNARYSHLKKFAIMITDQGACETNPQDWRENMIPYIIEYFFKDSRYMKVDGKPLLSIYEYGHFLQMFGGDAGARQAIQTLRDEVAKAGFPGLVVLMELRNADPNVMKTMKSMGVDYCYAYTWHGPDVNGQRHNNITQRDAAVAEKFGVLPSISMGWDAEPWGAARGGGWVPADDYRALLHWTRDELMPSHPADSLGRKIVMLPNWNEFGEGHFLMPSTLTGFGYVDAMREVFAGGGAHEDAKPTDQQKKRFTLLYPKD